VLNLQCDGCVVERLAQSLLVGSVCRRLLGHAFPAMCAMLGHLRRYFQSPSNRCPATRV
jgi:hypothetical protein